MSYPVSILNKELHKLELDSIDSTRMKASRIRKIKELHEAIMFLDLIQQRIKKLKVSNPKLRPYEKHIENTMNLLFKIA